MFPCADRPILPADVTTINYSLDWPHLHNPSNTTFAGLTQIDICHCQRTDLSPQKDTEPGHIYTRFKCVEPVVRFKTAKEDLWVLEAPHGPINMLRPATEEEKAQRSQIYPDAGPSVYQGRKFLFLTGPCPRGRYQAYATLKWLTLNPHARKHISCLCLLIQPYEEDSSAEATRKAYKDLAEYLVRHAPGFEKLYLLVCPNGMQLCSAASEFGILLQSRDVKIIVVIDDCCSRETREYDDPSVFSETMMAMARRPPPLQTVSEPPQKHETEGHGSEVAEPSGLDKEKEEEGKEGKEEKDEAKEKDKKEHDDDDDGEEDEKEKEDQGEEDSVDGDWTDATMSPTSPQNELDKDWQML